MNSFYTKMLLNKTNIIKCFQLNKVLISYKCKNGRRAKRYAIFQKNYIIHTLCKTKSRLDINF